MREQIFERLRILDAIPNQTLIDSFNHRFAHKNDKHELIVNEKIRPCFFSGDVETKGKIVTVSLNPKYTRQVSEEEQVNMNFTQWYKFCRFRFKRYESDSAVHSTFKKLLKITAPPTLWKTIDKRDYLQANLINLDWCFYYSEYFPTFDFSKLPESLQNNIYETWDKNLNWLIKTSKPRYIFVHSKPIKNWVYRNTSELEQVMQLESRPKSCWLHEGKLSGTTIPVYYLEHHITNVNKDATLEAINCFINNREQNR
ncbi:hypothetical protein BH20ACI1_BH20ACI1_04950 [soil metagenome]